MRAKWNDKTITAGIYESMQELGIERMPINVELVSIKQSGLAAAIGATGGFGAWANKLNLETKKIVKKWDDNKVKNALFECMKILNIDRMPTATELKSLDRNDLHCRISKTKKYSGWAKELGLTLKASATTTGQEQEKRAKKVLEGMGYKVESMSTKFPYDLLVNDCIKVDVKASRKHGGYCIFGINKTNPTSDLYICLVFDDEKEIVKTFVIPSHFVKTKTLNVSPKSEYNRFIDAWHYLKVFDDFYKTIK